MTMPVSRKCERGFTLLELLLVVALVIIFFVVAVENLLPLRGDAERSSVLATVGVLSSATGLEASRRAVRGGSNALADMDGANPMEWLATRPGNYAGEMEQADFERVPRGNWVFFPESGLLFYRVRYPEYFEGDFTSPPGIRFRVMVAMGSAGTPRWIELRRLDEAAWDTSGSEIDRWMEAVQ